MSTQQSTVSVEGRTKLAAPRCLSIACCCSLLLNPARADVSVPTAAAAEGEVHVINYASVSYIDMYSY